MKGELSASRAKAGHIPNVASIAAFQPIPSLSEEFKGTGVRMTALCPGITAESVQYEVNP